MARRYKIGCGGITDYFEMCDETQGFDVNSAGRALCGGIVEFDKSEKDYYEEAITCAKFALDKENKEKGTDLQYASLIKYNGQLVEGIMFYITFRARPRTSPPPRTRKRKRTCAPTRTRTRTRTLEKTSVYQAKVWYRGESDDPEVKLFREKPKPAVPVPKGAFLCFMGKLSKVPLLSDWTREKKISLASRAWKSVSTEGKLRFYNAKVLTNRHISRFV